jgi:protein TonB
MERPQHAMSAVTTKSPQSRFIGLLVVGVIHVIVIAGLIIGLTNNDIKKKIVDISAQVVPKKEEVKPPPPPPPTMMKPPPVSVAPPPVISIAAPPPPPAPPKPQPPAAVAPPAPPPPPPTELKPITRTHTQPGYPPLSQRMGESGTVRLKVVIGTDGKVSECTVEKSSGSTRLDEAAASYVKEHWTWQPPTQQGKAVSATTLIDIVFDLKNAQ